MVPRRSPVRPRATRRVDGTDDVIIDGGNSYYRDDMARRPLRAGHPLDVGTSGGVFGLERPFCMMIGDPRPCNASIVFAALAPGMETAGRTPGVRSRSCGHRRAGLLRVSAGHFVKMVHNGIEYGLMAAFAEGSTSCGVPAFSIARTTPRPRRCAGPSSTGTTSTSPTSPGVATRGVVSSWLLDLRRRRW
jgi:6-phosphogluconate dehydrogenase